MTLIVWRSFATSSRILKRSKTSWLIMKHWSYGLLTVSMRGASSLRKSSTFSSIRIVSWSSITITRSNISPPRLAMMLLSGIIVALRLKESLSLSCLPMYFWLTNLYATLMSPVCIVSRFRRRLGSMLINMLSSRDLICASPSLFMPASLLMPSTNQSITSLRKLSTNSTLENSSSR